MGQMEAKNAKEEGWNQELACGTETGMPKGGIRITVMNKGLESMKPKVTCRGWSVHCRKRYK